MSEFPSVISFGEALWDVFCDPGGRQVRRVGGAPANFAFHVAQHGMTACALSGIGQDAPGDELAAALDAAGAPCSLQHLPYATGCVHIELVGAGLPRYSIQPDAAWDHLAASPDWLELAARARVICFGSLAQRSEASRTALVALLEAAGQRAEVWRLFDVNLRCACYTQEILRDSLTAANVVKLNDEEMEILGRSEGFSGLPQLEQARLLMQRYGLHLLILTCGALGSYVLGEGGQLLSWQATPQVHVVDTVGAGDSFTATMVAALLRGLSVPAAHAAAVKVSAYVCTQPGAMPPLPESLRLGNPDADRKERIS